MINEAPQTQIPRQYYGWMDVGRMTTINFAVIHPVAVVGIDKNPALIYLLLYVQLSHQQSLIGRLYNWFVEFWLDEYPTDPVHPQLSPNKNLCSKCRLILVCSVILCNSLFLYPKASVAGVWISPGFGISITFKAYSSLCYVLLHIQVLNELRKLLKTESLNFI